MFGKFFSSSKTDNEDAPEKNQDHARRKHPRRSSDSCVSVIGGKVYPVENWSYGGLLVRADDRLFGVNEEMDITVKFKLRDDVLDIPHKAKIVRKAPNKIALQFTPVSKKIQNAFDRVIDDFVAKSFVDSQLA